VRFFKTPEPHNAYRYQLMDDPRPPHLGPGKEMPFIEHLEELRWHIIRSAIAILLLMVVAFLAKGLVFDTLIFAPTHADFITYRILCKISEWLHTHLLCIDEVGFDFINIELAAQFLIHLKVSLILGFVVAFPYVAWEIWRFIKPGLYEMEVRYTHGVVFFTTLLFFTGICFGYYVLTPFSLNFFGNYTVSDDVVNSFTFTNYIGFLTMFVLAAGIIFELPIAVYFLSKLGLLTPEFMRTYRKHAVIAILLISAIITPADIGTQILVGVPVYFLYEISIFISASVVRRQRQELES